MGGKSSESTQQTSQTTPWAPAQQSLSGILGHLNGINPNLTGTESGALNTLNSNASAGNPFAGQIGNVAGTLLGGGPDRTGMLTGNLENYQNSLAPTIGGQYLDPSSNPFFSQTVNTIGNDVQNRVNAMYAGAGRDPAGAGSYGQTLGRGIAEATAPIFANQYQQERGNQMNAMSSMFGAGAQTGGLLNQFDQSRMGNMQAGIGAADSALSAQNYGPMQQLAVEAMRAGIPLERLAGMAGISLPMAQAFGTQTGTAQKEGQMSGADQFLKITGGLGALFGSGKK